MSFNRVLSVLMCAVVVGLSSASFAQADGRSPEASAQLLVQESWIGTWNGINQYELNMPEALAFAQDFDAAEVDLAITLHKAAYLGKGGDGSRKYELGFSDVFEYIQLYDAQTVKRAIAIHQESLVGHAAGGWAMYRINFAIAFDSASKH